MKLKLIAAVLMTLAATASFAQQYPSRPIKVLVTIPPGGAPDIAARLLAQKMSESIGLPVLVENRTGANGNVAADIVAKAPPDGYTLVMAASSSIVTNVSLYDKLPFDPVKDLAPISQVCFTANILAVNNDVPAKNVQELVALARARPGELTFGSAGVGTSQHLAGELFKAMAGISLQHVPYRGIAQVMPDLLGGRLTMSFGNISAVLPLTRENKVRAMAVTSIKRSASVPNLPTMAEQGFPGFDSTAWFGLMAPAGTPSPIVAKLHAETAKILARADVREKFATLGMEVIGNTPAEFSDLIKAEIPVWAKIIKASGAKATE
jgi:tripartite-type tricarboxylate transporter receptor subunit TctC